jgi:hypothetical protein
MTCNRAPIVGYRNAPRIRLLLWDWLRIGDCMISWLFRLEAALLLILAIVIAALLTLGLH